MTLVNEAITTSPPSQVVACTGASVAAALNLTSSPNYIQLSTSLYSVGQAVAVGNPIFAGDPNQLAAVYISLGGASVVASPTTSFLVTPAKPVLINLAAVGSPTWIAALAGAGNSLLIQFLNL